MADRDEYGTIIIEQDSGIGAFLVGAAIGVGVALLFAPRSGRETRDELAAGLERLRARADETVRDLQDAVTETVEGVRGEVTGRLDTAREAFDNGRRAARDARYRIERGARQARAGVRAGIDTARRPDPAGHELDADYDG